MSKNMGTVDRALRVFVVAPVAIVIALLIGTATAGGIVLLVVAGIMLLTSATGFCPNYTLLGISTRGGLHRVGRHLRGRHA